MELKGKVVLITGASSGIGKAIAQNLDAVGAKLVLTARSEDELNKLADSLTDAKVLAGNLTDPDMPQKLLDYTLDAFGQIDILINNAGMMVVGSIEEVDIDKICLMARLNVESMYRMAYTALKHFRKADSGFLVNTSSIAGLKNAATFGAYSGTKHAIESFTDCLRVELAGSGIRVAAIAPGTVNTGLYDDWDGESKAQMKNIEIIQPDDVARCVRFMLEQPEGVLIPRLLVVPKDQPI